jgi:hypothetical protein
MLEVAFQQDLRRTTAGARAQGLTSRQHPWCASPLVAAE